MGHGVVLTTLKMSDKGGDGHEVTPLDGNIWMAICSLIVATRHFSFVRLVDTC